MCCLDVNVKYALLHVKRVRLGKGTKALAKQKRTSTAFQLSSGDVFPLISTTKMCTTASERRANSRIGLFTIKKTKALPKLHSQSALGTVTPYCVGLDIALCKMKVMPTALSSLRLARAHTAPNFVPFPSVHCISHTPNIVLSPSAAMPFLSLCQCLRPAVSCPPSFPPGVLYSNVKMHRVSFRDSLGHESSLVSASQAARVEQ